MNSEDRNKLSMAFISPQTMKCSPIQLHFPHGLDGSPNLPKEKNGWKTPLLALQPVPMALECSKYSKLTKVLSNLVEYGESYDPNSILPSGGISEHVVTKC